VRNKLREAMAKRNTPSVQRDHSHTVADHAHISFRLPADQLDALRIRAREEDRSLAAQVRRAVTEHLEKAA
jgi:hypothetical protein